MAAAALPGAVAVSQALKTFKLLHAWPAIPVAVLGGLAAISLARRARARLRLTLGRARGARPAATGRWLGIIAVYLGLTALLTLGFYELLLRFSD